MIRREKGQGLLEYALLLVLVAVVVIAIIDLLAPQIHDVFCEIIYALSIGPDNEYTLVVSMGLNDESVTFDVRYGPDEDGRRNTCYDRYEVVEWSNPSHGSVEHLQYATFTYRPTVPGAGVDDSFSVDWHHTTLTGPDDIHTDNVTIIVGEPDLAISQSNLLSTVEDTTREKIPKTKSNEEQEAIFDLMEAIDEQEENLREGVDLAIEASVEGLEELTEFADNTGNILLSDSLSQLLAEVKAGNLESVQDSILQIAVELAQTPVEVWLDMSLKMAPSLTKSCVVISEATVPPETIAAAFQSIEGLDDAHPGKADALALLQEGVANIEARNTAAVEYVDFQSAVLQTFVAAFEYVGEYEIAAQLAADSEACGN